ncbi:MAG TPA: hypothetical protein VH575_18585 [Gemmataceae bacterium]
MEGALQAEDALAAGRLAQARLAGRQHPQLQLAQRQAGDGLGGENATVGLVQVGPGQDHAR